MKTSLTELTLQVVHKGLVGVFFPISFGFCERLIASPGPALIPECVSSSKITSNEGLTWTFSDLHAFCIPPWKSGLPWSDWFCPQILLLWTQPSLGSFNTIPEEKYTYFFFSSSGSPCVFHLSTKSFTFSLSSVLNWAVTSAAALA